MSKTTKMLAVAMTVLIILTACSSMNTANQKEVLIPAVINTAFQTPTYETTDLTTVKTLVKEEPILESELISKEDLELLALITMAEAEGESEEGKRLVIDTVLNRVNSKYFPDTIHDVIYQPNQFTPMWNGRIDRCEVREDICQLVREELDSRTNHDVVFFNARHYSVYGVPLFQVGNHYFSSYN